jgi:hypothetical protein
VTAVPRELAHKQPANTARRDDRVIDGIAWERNGIVTGRLVAWIVFALFFGAGFLGLLLSLITQNA